MEVQWKIVDHPLPNGKRTDFEKYDSAAKELASGFIVNAVYDNRDNSINPSRGLYAGVQFRSNLPSTTWDVYSNTGRGYIQGRFRGSKMVYLESEYRIALTANGLLGMVVFVNAESDSAPRAPTASSSISPKHSK